jgi:hypothetical protein
MRQNRMRMGMRTLAVVGLVAGGVALTAPAAQAQAETATINERLRFDNQTFTIPAGVPRAGQTFTLNGGLHLLLHLTVSSSQNCLVKGHANPQGLSVTFAGTTYRAVGAANFTAHSRKEGNVTRFHAVVNLGLRAQKGPPERLKINFKADVAPSCRTIHNLAVEAVELLQGGGR